MADVIDSALIEIFPDFEHFNRDLQAKLRTIGPVKIRAELDEASLRNAELRAKRIQAAVNRGNRRTVAQRNLLSRLDRETARADAQRETRARRIETIERRIAAARHKVDVARAAGRGEDVQLKLELNTLEARRQLAVFTRDRNMEVEVNLDIDKARARLVQLAGGGVGGGRGGVGGDLFAGVGKAFSAVLSLFGGGRIGKIFTPLIQSLQGVGEAGGEAAGGLSKAGSSMSSMVASSAAGVAVLAVLVAAFAGLVLAIASVIAALIVAATALAAATAAALGLAAAIGVGLFAALSRVTTTVGLFNKAQEASRKAMAGATEDADAAARAIMSYRDSFLSLSPAAQGFTNFITGELLPAIQVLQGRAEAAFLPGLQTALQNMMRLAAPFITFLEDIGRQFGQLSTVISTAFTTGPGLAAIQQFFASAKESFDILIPAARDLAQAFLTIFGAGSSTFVSLAQWIAEAAAQFNAWIQRVSQSGQLASFFQQASEYLRIFLDLAVELGRTLFVLIEVLAPIGRMIAEAFLVGLRAFNEFADSLGGKSVIIGIIVTLIGTFVIVLGILAIALAALLLPFAALGAALGLLAAALIGIVGAAREFAGAVDEVRTALESLPGPFGSAAQAAFGFRDALWDNIEALKAMPGPLGGLASALDWIRDKFNPPTQTEWVGPRVDTSGLEQFQKELRETQRIQAEVQRAAQVTAALGAYAAWQDAIDDVASAQQRLDDVNDQNAQSAKAAARAVADAQEGVADANQRVKDAQQGVVDAQDRVKEAYERVTKAQQDLIEAREEATRKLRDQPDTEESLRIALAQAEITELETRGLSAQNLARRRALLDVKNAREDLQDFQADRISTVEEDPSVISAREAVKNAREDVNDAKDDVTTAQKGVIAAQKEVAKAHQRVTDAQEDQTRATNAGARAWRDADNALKTANEKLKTQEINARKAAAELGLDVTEVGKLQTALDKIKAKYIVNLELHKGNVDLQLRDTLEYLEAIKLVQDPKNANKSIAEILKMAENSVQATINKNAETHREDTRLTRAAGGSVFGAGTATSDSIPAYLSNGEHVWTAREVKAAGGHAAVERLRKSVLHRAAGGAVRINLDRFVQDENMISNSRKAFYKAYGMQHPTVVPTSGVGGPAALRSLVGTIGVWPASPAAQRYDSGVWRVVRKLIEATGPISGTFGNGYRDGDPLWHGSGRAVDWMGYNQDKLATYLASLKPLELIHRSGNRDYAYTRGRDMGSFDEALMNAHRNHIHVAMGMGGAVVADNGAILPPHSVTTVANNTGQPEHVGFPMSRREKIELAQLIAQALHTKPTIVEMDKKVVAESSQESLAAFMRGGNSYA